MKKARKIALTTCGENVTCDFPTFIAKHAPGISLENITDRGLQKVFRQAALIVHPDKHRTKKEEQTIIFQQMQVYYDEFCDLNEHDRLRAVKEIGVDQGRVEAIVTEMMDIWYLENPPPPKIRIPKENEEPNFLDIFPI